MKTLVRVTAALALIAGSAYLSLIVVNCPGQQCSAWPMGAPTIEAASQSEEPLPLSELASCAANTFLRGDGTCVAYSGGGNGGTFMIGAGGGGGGGGTVTITTYDGGGGGR